MLNPRLHTGHAMTETLVALLALAPFLVGVQMLGKQLDVKHKTYDAARYAVWERTVWSSHGSGNRKTEAEIEVETRDRALGDPGARTLAVSALRSRGISENPFWRDHQRRRMLDYERGTPISLQSQEGAAPVEAGRLLIPGLAYGEEPVSIASIVRADDLNLDRDTFARASVLVALVPALAQYAGRSEGPQRAHAQLLHQATGALLSDTWSSQDETQLRRRVDRLTANELIEDLERPGRPIAMQARAKGAVLYGEGQYGWDPDLQPRSNALPAAYLTSK